VSDLLDDLQAVAATLPPAGRLFRDSREIESDYDRERELADDARARQRRWERSGERDIGYAGPSGMLTHDPTGLDDARLGKPAQAAPITRTTRPRGWR
jgi:hypothetical protein